jgi:hypothetical protein
LRGRFLLPDGSEHPCETIDVSVTGLAVSAYVVADPGERVVLEVDALGCFDGVVTRRGNGWFAIQTKTTPNRIERLARNLAELSGGGDDFSCAGPPASPLRSAELRTEFGQSFTVRLVDETRAGARVLADFKLLRGAHVTVDHEPAVVVHETSDGFIVAFRERQGGSS